MTKKYCNNCVLECYKEGLDVKEEYHKGENEICGYCGRK